MTSNQNCCQEDSKQNRQGIKQGIIYGLIPHTFCILFIIFTIFGSVAGATIAKKFLLIPHFFFYLLLLSLLFATISSWLYLQKNKCCSLDKIKRKWKYLTILYGLTITVNIAVIYFIFPALANTMTQQKTNDYSSSQLINELNIQVNIPCSGHAPLIIDEINKGCDVQFINYQSPDYFEIKYNPEETSINEILSLEIFETYQAKIIK